MPWPGPSDRVSDKTQLVCLGFWKVVNSQCPQIQTVVFLSFPESDHKNLIQIRL